MDAGALGRTVRHARYLCVRGPPRGGVGRRRPIRPDRRFPADAGTLELGLTGTVGNLDGQLHADGTLPSARDTLVASPAREHGYALVTRDRDFEDVPGLDVILYDE